MGWIRFPLTLQTESIRFSETLTNENTQLILQHLGGSPPTWDHTHVRPLCSLACCLLPCLVGLCVSTLVREMVTQGWRKDRVAETEQSYTPTLPNLFKWNKNIFLLYSLSFYISVASFTWLPFFVLRVTDIRGLYRPSLFPLTMINCIFFLMFKLSQSGQQASFWAGSSASSLLPQTTGVGFAFLQVGAVGPS